jgi:NADH-quinone oxidoreductase subunit N
MAYVSFEIQSLCLYLLAAFNRNPAFSTEAGIKYFVLGALASCFIVFGFYFIDMNRGSLFLRSVFLFFFFRYLKITLGIVPVLVCPLLFRGFFLSSLLRRFTFWLQAFTRGHLLFRPPFFQVFLKHPFFFFCKILYSYFPLLIGFWSIPLSLSAFLSILLGTLGALFQTKLKRLLAYSGVVNSGLVFLGFSSGTLEGLFSRSLCFLIFIFSSFSVWSFVGFLKNLAPRSTPGLVFITKISSLFSLNTPPSYSLLLMLFSLAGGTPFKRVFLQILCFFIPR